MSLKKYVPQPIKKFIIDLKKRAFDNKKKLTLKKICSIIDVEVPSNLKKLQNIRVTNKIILRFNSATCLSIYIITYKR